MDMHEAGIAPEQRTGAYSSDEMATCQVDRDRQLKQAPIVPGASESSESSRNSDWSWIKCEDSKTAGQ